jgi:hypothetical protein
MHTGVMQTDSSKLRAYTLVIQVFKLFECAQVASCLDDVKRWRIRNLVDGAFASRRNAARC